MGRKAEFSCFCLFFYFYFFQEGLFVLLAKSTEVLLMDLLGGGSLDAGLAEMPGGGSL